MAKQKGRVLDFKEDFTREDFIMQLYSQECLIMNIKGKVKSKKKGSEAYYPREDIILDLNYQFQKQEKQIDKSLEIQMITKSENNFNRAMDQIEQDLELENYSNNKTEHIENLNKFMKSFYPTMTIKKIQKHNN